MSEKKKYYFEYSSIKPKRIDTIESLISLNIQKTYYLPGNITRPERGTSPNEIVAPIIRDLNGYETSGIFRGQIKDWDLIPKCYRDSEIDPNIQEKSEFQQRYNFHRALYDFNNFCSRAESQNLDFPTSISDRLSIAQHFGVKTPLLDWSKNIFTAIFFAIRDIYSDETFQETFEVYLYHIKDERFLKQNLPPEQELARFFSSTYLKPFAIDRRIERQKGVFTFHPYPGLEDGYIPVDTYVFDYEIVNKLIKLMKGFGYTEDYFFPDYAGIADIVNKETVL